MKLFKYSVLVLAVGLFSATSFAQSKADLIKLYNQADKQATEKKYEDAISTFTQVITVAEQLGSEGTDIKQRSENAIPGLYFQKAVAQYQAFQKSKSMEDLDLAINEFQQASSAAEQFGNTEINQRSTGIITQLHYNKGLIAFKSENYDVAMQALNRATELNGNYGKAFYQKALVYKKTNPNDVDGMLTRLDKAIEVANATNDAGTARLATNKAHDELIYRGTKSTENKRFDQSVTMLTKALNYDESADAHYRLAEAYNKQSKYDSALSHANKALSLEKGSRTEKAKIYFELGLANQFKNNKTDACDAFDKAAIGQFKAPAEHKMEFELKCKTANP